PGSPVPGYPGAYPDELAPPPGGDGVVEISDVLYEHGGKPPAGLSEAPQPRFLVPESSQSLAGETAVVMVCPGGRAGVSLLRGWPLDDPGPTVCSSVRPRRSCPVPRRSRRYSCRRTGQPLPHAAQGAARRGAASPTADLHKR